MLLPAVVAEDRKREEEFNKKHNLAVGNGADSRHGAGSGSGGNSTSGGSGNTGGSGRGKSKLSTSGGTAGGGGGGGGGGAGGSGGGVPPRKTPRTRDAILQDQISFELIPDETCPVSARFPKLSSPYLLTSNQLRIGKIRKHVARQLKVEDPQQVKLEGRAGCALPGGCLLVGHPRAYVRACVAAGRAVRNARMQRRCGTFQHPLPMAHTGPLPAALVPCWPCRVVASASLSQRPPPVFHTRNGPCRFQVELLCKNEPLGSDLTLQYIKVSRWYDDQRNMVLHYRRKVSLY